MPHTYLHIFYKQKNYVNLFSNLINILCNWIMMTTKEKNTKTLIKMENIFGIVE